MRRAVALILAAIVFFGIAGCHKYSAEIEYYVDVQDGQYPHLFAYEEDQLVVFNLGYEEYVSKMAENGKTVTGELDRSKIFQFLSLNMSITHFSTLMKLKNENCNNDMLFYKKGYGDKFQPF